MELFFYVLLRFVRQILKWKIKIFLGKKIINLKNGNSNKIRKIILKKCPFWAFPQAIISKWEWQIEIVFEFFP